MRFCRKRFIAWASKNFDMPILEEFIHATRTSNTPSSHPAVVPLTRTQLRPSLSLSPKTMFRAMKVRESWMKSQILY